MNTKYPLLLPCTAGRSVLDRYGFKAEAPTVLQPPVVDPVADLIVSAHAPFSDSSNRYSIADVDDTIRSASIDAIVAYIKDAAERFPNLLQINMHASPKQFAYDTFTLLGDYDRLIEAIRTIAAEAQRRDLLVVVENNRAYWDGVADDALPSTVDRSNANDYFATEPDEWLQVQRDVDCDNVFLCLDTSHACTFAQTVDGVEARERIMMQYLEAGDALRHVHWNGNDLATPVGRQDTHMSLHEDGLSRELHRRLRSWNATLLLEHWYGEEKLEEELAFISGL